MIRVPTAPPEDRDLNIPKKAGPEDAAYDLTAAIQGEVHLQPGERALIPAGFKIQIPFGYVGLVCPRSGLAYKYGLTVLNAPGVIDPGFRGEVGVVLINLGAHPQIIMPGDRIAQLLVVAAPELSLLVQSDLPGSERGEGGFGSTGR